MPELPEIETLVKDLNGINIPGRVIKSLAVQWPKTVNGATQDEIKTALTGKRIQEITRRGKYVVFKFHDESLALLHLRMSGRLLKGKHGEALNKHEQFSIRLDDNSELRFHDPRKFGRFYFGPGTNGRLNKLGPEPLSPALTEGRFNTLIRRHSRMIKPLLLDQTFLAGLGNICADESLWEARIHPKRSSSTLKAAEGQALYKAIRSVLRRSISNRGTSLGDGQSNFVSVTSRKGKNVSSLNVYGRAGEPCPCCRTKILRTVIGQRGTFLCPACQRINGCH